MSKKKQRNKQNPTENCSVDENTKSIDSNSLLDYLRTIMKRYSGYNFISVSKAHGYYKENEEPFVVQIVVHKSLPIQDEHGRYASDKDQFVRFCFTSNSEFAGMVMDREKHFINGNPFKSFEEKKDTPSISLSSEAVPKEEPAEDVFEPL